jgi:glucose-6-phosphate isomerase
MPDYRRKATRTAMSVRVDFNGILADAVGEAGVDRGEIESLTPRLKELVRSLEAQRAAGEISFYDLPNQKDAVTDIKDLAAELREESDCLVVLGIGGSSLGTRTVVGALECDRRVIVADNVDPQSFGELIDGLDLSRTTFNVISKSGETAETMSQFLIVRDLLLRTFGAVDYTRHVVITTDAESGALRQVVHDEGFRSLPIPAGVGGRFSVLTAVGLLPAAFAGLRIDDLLAGAAWMDQRCREADVWRNPGHLLGTSLYLADTRRKQNVVVLMPYSDRLRYLSAWFAQLWAESLGKNETLEGTSVNVGQTPVTAVGATDQHSLLQLFAEGPADKVVMMLRVEDHGRDIAIPSGYADLESLNYLGNTGLGGLLNLEQRATELSLVKKKRPVITISVPQINAFTIGQLFFLFEAAVVFAGGLYRINPFNQPGVEESKRLTYGQMGRKGYEKKRAEVEEWTKRKRDEYIV